MAKKNKYRAPCFTDGRGGGAECGRANVPVTNNPKEVRCPGCREYLEDAGLLPKRKKIKPVHVADLYERAKARKLPKPDLHAAPRTVYPPKVEVPILRLFDPLTDAEQREKWMGVSDYLPDTWIEDEGNKRRAHDGYGAVMVASDNDSEDGKPLHEQNIADAIANLLHFAAYNGVNLINVLRRGVDNFTAEATGDV